MHALNKTRVHRNHDYLLMFTIIITVYHFSFINIKMELTNYIEYTLRINVKNNNVHLAEILHICGQFSVYTQRQQVIQIEHGQFLQTHVLISQVFKFLVL